MERLALSSGRYNHPLFTKKIIPTTHNITHGESPSPLKKYPQIILLKHVLLTSDILIVDGGSDI